MQPSDRERLAQQFIGNAMKVGAGDNVWIEYQGRKAKVLAESCAAATTARGGIPRLVDGSASTINGSIGHMTPVEIEAMAPGLLAEMEQMQCYIRVRDDADKAHIHLTEEQRKAYGAAVKPMTQHRVKHTRWLVISTPTEEFAEACNMPMAEFEKFYLDVCLVDYGRMTEAVKPLQKIMAEGKTVHILSPAQETDLRFSIAGQPAIPCTGTVNIPDGECFTSPVRDSIDGTIKFGPSNYDGQNFPWIKLTFAAGKIVDARSASEERTKALNDILDRDEGARYIGEFAINFNPFIKHPVGDILFDEKIDGGIHMAAGSSYGDAPNGNDSQIHWDMVHIQRPDYGGGALYIDDVLIRQDGIFTLPELQALNPENLKAVAAA